MRQTDATDSYLAAADRAGHLVVVDGLPCVAGPSHEPDTGAAAVLVEYAHPTLLDSREALDALVRGVARGHPTASAVMLRAPVPPRHWEPVVTYVVLDQPQARADIAGLVVLPVEGDARITSWLSSAMRAAASVSSTSIAQAVASVVQDPRFTALGAFEDGEMVGAASVMAPERDRVTDLPFCDLLDIWIEGTDRRRDVMAALVQAVSAFADERDLCVVGNVTYRRGDVLQGHDVLRRLLKAGWVEWYSISRLPLERDV